jgi:hypothetical protein
VRGAELAAEDVPDADERDAVPDTQKIHAQLADGRDGFCCFKRLICLCTRCKEKEYDQCERPGYADAVWLEKEIRCAPAPSGPRRSARGEASSVADDIDDQLEETPPSSWRDLAVGLEKKDTVAIAYHFSDDHDYYLVQLADEPWHVVPAGEVRATTLQQPRGALFSLRVCFISLS